MWDSRYIRNIGNFPLLSVYRLNSKPIADERGLSGLSKLFKLQLGNSKPYGYWKRRKIAIAILSLIQLPVVAWYSYIDYMPGLIMGIGFILWMTVLIRSHTLRGWSVRIPAEVIADLLRVTIPVVTISSLILILAGHSFFIPLIIHGLTFTGLAIHTLFWRGRPKSWVRILGSPSNLGAAVSTFGQCMDLLGRDGCRFAPFRADKPEPEAWKRRILAWLDRGETVLVVEPQLQSIARKLQSAGDVIFARDCLLFTPIGKPAGRITDMLLAGINRILAIIAALFLWPVMLVIFVLIKLDDAGPSMFVQQRIGKGGVPFDLYKFRSMKIDAPKYAVHPNGDDPRVTRIGKILRKLSLDELPQIINVLKGDMRLVGPRPEMPFIVDKYNAVHKRRLAITPGITGLWQVSPHRNEPIHEHIEYDLAYIAHRGPILDLALIIATAGLANSSGN